MHFKWGYDGLTGLPHFNLAYKKEPFDDTKMYGCWLVPICLVLENGSIVYNNPSPSSPRSCIPLSLEYVAESAGVTNRVSNAVKEQEECLQNCEYFFEEKGVSIFHMSFMLTSFNMP